MLHWDGVGGEVTGWGGVWNGVPEVTTPPPVMHFVRGKVPPDRERISEKMLPRHIGRDGVVSKVVMIFRGVPPWARHDYLLCLVYYI